MENIKYYKGDLKRRILKLIVPSVLYDVLSRKASVKRYLKNGKGDLHTADGFHYYKCIFVHIPKTAGLSVAQSVFNNFGAGHYSLRQYQQIFSKRIFNKYFKFAIVRNPYKRFESAYYYLLNGGFDKRDHLWAEKNIKPYKDINEFVEFWLNPSSMNEMIHFKPQTFFIKDSTGKVNLDYLGRLESLAEDYKVIKSKLGVDGELKKINTAKEKQQRIGLSQKSKDKIFDFYREDFEVLNYEK